MSGEATAAQLRRECEAHHSRHIAYLLGPQQQDLGEECGGSASSSLATGRTTLHDSSQSVDVGQVNLSRFGEVLVR
jgi:hypothetical protein